MYEVCKTSQVGPIPTRASNPKIGQDDQNAGLSPSGGVQPSGPHSGDDSAQRGPDTNRSDANPTQEIRERIFARRPDLRAAWGNRDKSEDRREECAPVVAKVFDRQPNQYDRDPRYEITIIGKKAFVQLTKGAIAVIDAEDAERVGQHLWRVKEEPGHRRYARNDRVGSMHRFILGEVEPGLVVDHIDGDGLNNRKANLRACTTADNIRNSRKYTFNSGKKTLSTFRGVTNLKGESGWRAQIMVNGVKINLGRYPTQELAARAYDMAARVHFGRFANTNFQEEAAPSTPSR